MADEMLDEATRTGIQSSSTLFAEKDVLFLVWSLMNCICFGIVFVYYFREHAPYFLHGFFKWGKTNSDAKSVSNLYHWLHVPNSWFTHFYIVGVVWSLLLLWNVYVLCFKVDNVSWISSYSWLLGSPITSSHTNCASLVFGLVLLLIQVSRRLLECLFVSVFTGKIHVSHYAVGVIFYLLAGASLVTPFFITTNTDSCNSCAKFLQYTQWHHAIALALFTWASWHQLQCHVILSKLRQTATGEQVKVHRIPFGDWFEYISSPHYFAEILIYLAFVIVQKGTNIYLWFMLLFVIQNLSLGATVTQNWYHNKFKEYPKSRFRIIPYLF